MKRRIFKYLIPVFVMLAIVLILCCNYSDKATIKSLISGGIDINVDDNEKPICINADILDYINNNTWDILFNLDTKTAIVDNQEIEMTTLLNVDEKELDNIVKSSDFKEYLEDNLTGDVEYVNGQVVVSNPYSSGTIIVETEDKKLLDSSNAKEVKQIIDDIYLVKYEDAKATKEAYYNFSENSEIISVATDAKVYISDAEMTQIDSLTSMNSSWATAFCGMDQYTKYLNYSQNSNIVKVAVLDTGIYPSHEVFKVNDFGERIDFTYSKNYISNNTNVTDDHGHGTAVSGLIAEATPSNVIIVPLKVMDQQGRGYLSYVFNAIGDIYRKVDVINISLGSKIADVSPHNITTYDNVLKKAREAGVIVCCAAGNSADSGAIAVEYPAASEYAYGVGAINKSKERCSFSNYGSEIDFVMPGYDLTLPGMSGQEAYVNTGGTSFASPTLAAAAALLKLEHKDYTFAQVDAELIKNTVDLGDVGRDKYYGRGYVDFNVDKFAKPVFIDATQTITEWAKYNRIKITALGSTNITHYAITNSSNTPSSLDWKITSGDTFLNETYETKIPGKNYVWLKDKNGSIAYKEVQITNIDLGLPSVVNEIEIVDLSKTSFKVQTTFKDSESGLSKIEWHLENADGNEINYIVSQSDPVGTNNNVTFTREFKNLTENTKYTVYAIGYDVVGNINFTKTFSITTNKADVNVFFLDNGTTKMEVEENENIEAILNTKRQEFEAAKTRIYNKNFSTNNEGIIFEDNDSLFVNSDNEISFPIIEDETLYENYSSNVKYYILKYKICYIKKKIDLSSFKDVVLNYGDENINIGKVKLPKNKFTVTTNDGNIVKIMVDDNSNVLVGSNNYAGNTQVVIDIEETLTLAHVTKTINVEVKPITIKIKSVTLDEKIYDGESEVNVLDVIFEGLLEKDKLEINKDYIVSALFDTPDIGKDKTVYLNVALTKTNLAKSYVIENENITMKSEIKPPFAFLKGDINLDGIINADDAADAIEIFKTNAQTAENKAKGDMNDDGKVDAEDAALIIEYFKTHK